MSIKNFENFCEELKKEKIKFKKSNRNYNNLYSYAFNLKFFLRKTSKSHTFEILYFKTKKKKKENYNFYFEQPFLAFSTKNSQKAYNVIKSIKEAINDE